MKDYYDARADEYDATTYLAYGPEPSEQVAALGRALSSLPPARVLDVGCGTGFLTAYLRGDIVCLDHSARMIRQARARVPNARHVLADAPPLPFADLSFDRVFTGHFYGHLEEDERIAFLDEARRVASEIVVVDSAIQPGAPVEGRQERELLDGSRYVVWKRHFTPARLLEEVGGAGGILFEGSVFVAVRSGLR